MNEWGVVGVIIALVGLLATIIKPIVNLTKTITRLTVVVDRLEKGQTELHNDAHAAHKRLWDHNEKQDERIENHEQRINALERK